MLIIVTTGGVSSPVQTKQAALEQNGFSARGIVTRRRSSRFWDPATASRAGGGTASAVDDTTGNSDDSVPATANKRRRTDEITPKSVQQNQRHTYRVGGDRGSRSTRAAAAPTQARSNRRRCRSLCCSWWCRRPASIRWWWPPPPSCGTATPASAAPSPFPGLSPWHAAATPSASETERGDGRLERTSACLNSRAPFFQEASKAKARGRLKPTMSSPLHRGMFIYSLVLLCSSVTQLTCVRTVLTCVYSFFFSLSPLSPGDLLVDKVADTRTKSKRKQKIREGGFDLRRDPLSRNSLCSSRAAALPSRFFMFLSSSPSR
jgi:hypothetical protein